MYFVSLDQIRLINLNVFFGIEGNVALNRNLEYNNLLLRLTPGDIYSACSHKDVIRFLAIL